MSNWADDEAVKDFLTASGVLMPDGSALPASLFDGQALAAIKLIEQITGWQPFEGTVQTRVYDPPGRNLGFGRRGGSDLLNLNAGLLRLDGLAVNGETLTEGQHFWIVGAEPAYPAWGIKFWRPMIGSLQSITITGLWGRDETVSELVRHIQIKLAAASALTGIREAWATSNPVEWKDADVSERRSVEILSQIGEGFREEAMRLLESSGLKRVQVGIC